MYMYIYIYIHIYLYIYDTKHLFPQKYKSLNESMQTTCQPAPKPWQCWMSRFCISVWNWRALLQVQFAECMHAHVTERGKMNAKRDKEKQVHVFSNAHAQWERDAHDGGWPLHKQTLTYTNLHSCVSNKQGAHNGAPPLCKANCLCIAAWSRKTEARTRLVCLDVTLVCFRECGCVGSRTHAQTRTHTCKRIYTHTHTHTHTHSHAHIYAVQIPVPRCGSN